MKKEIIQNPDSVQDYLSTDNTCDFASNLKSLIKYYAKGIEIKECYIDRAIDRASITVNTAQDFDCETQDVLIDLVLSIGFWAKWAPESYDFGKYSNYINSLINNENPSIKAAALASLGFLWQRKPELVSDWLTFDRAFNSDEPIVITYSLFGFSNIIQNDQNAPPDSTIEALLKLTDNNDPEIRQETASIIERLSQYQPEKLHSHLRKLEFAHRSDIDNTVVNRLKRAITNIKQMKG